MKKIVALSITILVCFALAIFCFLFDHANLAIISGLVGLIELAKLMKSTTRKSIFEKA